MENVKNVQKLTWHLFDVCLNTNNDLPWKFYSLVPTIETLCVSNSPTSWFKSVDTQSSIIGYKWDYMEDKYFEFMKESINQDKDLFEFLLVKHDCSQPQLYISESPILNSFLKSQEEMFYLEYKDFIGKNVTIWVDLEYPFKYNWWWNVSLDDQKVEFDLEAWFNPDFWSPEVRNCNVCKNFHDGGWVGLVEYTHFMKQFIFLDNWSIWDFFG